MPVPTIVLLLVTCAALATAAGLLAALLRHADGATWPAATLTGGRAGLAVAGVLLAAVGVAGAGWRL